MKKLFLHIIFLLITMIYVNGQSLYSGAENSKNKSHIVNWTIGHTISSSGSSANYNITQGAIFNTYRMYFEETSKLSITCFPNPSEKYFFLEIKDNKPEKFTWAIFSEDGKLLRKEKANKSLTKIDISQYKAHLYHLCIIDNNDKIVASAKLIKK